MEASKKSTIIRSYRAYHTALIRLFDIAIFGFTLNFILDYYHIEFGYNQLWWLMISIFSFEFFAELNLLYLSPRGTNIIREIKRTLLSWLGVITVFFLINFFRPTLLKGLETQFLLWMSLVPLELVLWHFCSRLMVNYWISLRKGAGRVAIVGATSLGQELESIIKNETWFNYTVVGYFDDRSIRENGRHQINPDVISGKINDLIEKVKRHEIDIVYITLPLKAENRIKSILEALADTTAKVYYVPDLFGFDLLRSQLQNLHGIPVISIYDNPFYGIDGFNKRIFDIVLASIILIIIAIPMIGIALGVKLSSPGPILFKQRRYGFRGEEIIVWKFRSMTVCEDGEEIEQAKPSDPRNTPFGDFLRRTSLDELPQFINVLQGRMSIIGPRPHAVAHNELYRGQITGYMLRHKVKPGITGLAQINGYRGETKEIEKMEGRVHYDLEYIRNWSLWLDIKIFFLTFFKGFIN